MSVLLQHISAKIFEVSEKIRYVSLYVEGQLFSSQRPGVENASSSESDKYEELIVNPTLLKLVTQRGNIDCGGSLFVIIRYGSFYEFVLKIKGGHLSVGMDLSVDIIKISEKIQELKEIEPEW